MIAEEESNSRKRAKLQMMEKPPDPLAELSDEDEEPEKPTDIEMVDETAGDVLENSVYKSLMDVKMAVDLVVVSMVSNNWIKVRMQT